MTDDPKTPRPRQSLLLPVLIPVLLLVGIGIVLWGFSRLLLRMEPHAATATALVVAAGIVTVVGIVASRKRVGNGSLLTVGLGVVGVAMLASGAALLWRPRGGGRRGRRCCLAITAPEAPPRRGSRTRRSRRRRIHRSRSSSTTRTRASSTTSWSHRPTLRRTRARRLFVEGSGITACRPSTTRRRRFRRGSTTSTAASTRR